MNKFAQALNRDQALIPDGGLATQLESMGYDICGDLCSAKLLHTEPQDIIDAHRAYLEAGAKLGGGCCRTDPEDIAAIKGLLSPRDLAS